MIHFFDGFQVDTAQRELRRNGTSVEIEPKVFDLLLYLIERRDRVVSKDELLDALWPDVIVAPAALTSCVTRLRRALGEPAAAGEVIRTFHRRGYRFVGSPQQALDSTGGASPQPRSQAGSPPPMAVAASKSDYVGRAAELMQLLAPIDALIGGATETPALRVVLLRGDAGVGKSRTLEEVAAYATSHGVEVLVARCYEGEGAGGFLPWVRILRACAERRQSHGFAALAAHGAAEVARAVPSLRDVLPDASPSPVSAGEEGRAPFFDAVATLLSNAAAERPLLLMIDDLHWADPTSLLLLQFLINERPRAPLLIVAAFRQIEAQAPHPLARLLAALQREARCNLVTLGPLPHSDAYAVLRGVAGAEVEAALATTVVETTEGNPLFIGEYWRALVESGAVQLDAGRWQRHTTKTAMRVPDGIRALIGRRLEGLSEHCGACLKLAAVAGREFSFDLLLRASASARPTLLDSIDEAIAAHVIADAPGVPGRYRFTHTLLRDILYDGLSAMRRAEWHGQIGAALLELGGGESEEGQPDVAYHFIQAVPAGYASQALDQAQRAAERSTQLLAHEDAVRWLERALEIIDASSGIEAAHLRAQRAQVTLALADAVERAGEGQRAHGMLQSVARRARDEADFTTLGRAALGLTTQWTFHDPQLVSWLEEALAKTPEGALHTQLLSRLATALYPMEGTEARRTALCGEALDSAHRSADPAVIAAAIADSLRGLWHVSNVREQLSMAEELARVAPRAGDVRLTLTASVWRVVALLGLGRILEADREVERFAAAAAAARRPTFLWLAKQLEANLHLLHGRLGEAEQAVEAAFALARRVSESGSTYQYLGQLFGLRREQGRIHELEGAIGAAVADPGNLNVARWVIPYFYSELDRRAQARSLFEAAAAQGFGDIPPENARGTRLSALVCYAEVCGYLDARPQAQRLYDLMQPYAGQWAVMGWGILTNGSVNQSLSVLAAVLQHWDEAQRGFATALAEAREQEAVIHQVRTLHNFARMLLARAARDDHAKALELVESAKDLCQRFALRAFEQRLADLEDSARSALRPRKVASK